MQTNSWRRLLGPLLVAVVASVVVAESAQAQQTGLFPLSPIKRKRVPCTQEDPVYRIYKDQYFGYHPTLWRRFPSGWGAPSPEAPNKEASFKEIPLQPPTDWGGEDDQEDAAPGDQPPAQPNGAAARPNLPAPPGEGGRSPFEMDDPNAAPRQDTPPRQQPAPRDEPAPAPAAPADDPNRSPFETGPRATAPAAPELAPPATSTSSRSRRSTADAGTPLLAMPDAGVDEAYQAPDLGAPAVEARQAQAAAGHDHNHNHQAPRRNRLAAMMDNLGWSVSRR